MKKKIYIWRGYHNSCFPALLRKAWDSESLLVCAPPRLIDFSFLNYLPPGEIEWVGDWPQHLLSIRDGLYPRMHTPLENFPHQPLIGIFTSSSEGASPSLILYSKKNMVDAYQNIFSLFDMARLEQVYCYPQPYHVFGIILGYVAAMLEGIPAFMPEGAYASIHHQKWGDTLIKNQITLATPTHFQDLIRFRNLKQLQSPISSYSCILGGALVHQKLWHDAREILCIESPSIGYGCSEASPGLTHLPPGLPPCRDGDVGFALKHMELNLSADGLLSFRGSSVCLAIIREGIRFPQEIQTHDCLQRNRDGRYIFTHRSQWALNRGGELFGFEEIETLIKKNLSLEVLCSKWQHPRLGEELVIFILHIGPNAFFEAKVHNIRQWLSQAFGHQFTDVKFYPIDQIPYNDSIKIDRVEIARQTVQLAVQNMECQNLH